MFEDPDFALGTIEMPNACAESDGYAVMGGGHTATLVAGLADKMGHASTGGGACLDYIAGRPLRRGEPRAERRISASTDSKPTCEGATGRLGLPTF